MTDTQKQNIEIMRLQGVGYKRIAASLDISASTVKSYCQRNKLGGVTSPQAISAAGRDEDAVCKQCGKPLERIPNKKAKTFCDDSCRYSWWNANREQGGSLRHTFCVCCGKVIVSYGSKNRKYCGHACYINMRFNGGVLCDEGAV